MVPKLNRFVVLAILRAHAIILLGTALVFMALGAPQQLPQFLAGGALAGLNVIAILWSSSRVMAKKAIALTVALSVFKYGVLIALFWFATQAKVAVGLSFFIGLFLTLPSLGLTMYLINKNGNKWFTSTGHN